MESEHISRRIRILRESESRKIAAGEVIDRPLSVVRELLDNSIDAGATEISAFVDGGGIKRIRVTDNGTGMGGADLELCILPHATSKITSTEDIYTTRTLGFRGEALACIAACSKLEITSTPSKADEGRKIVVHGGKVVSHSEAAAVQGTTVDVADLFYSLPGRRKFLKRTASETLACRQAFIEKALPFPNISFRLTIDGEMKLFLPPQSIHARIADLHAKSIAGAFLTYDEAESEGIGIKGVLTTPDYSRRDRRFIQIYVNNRRIQEYALVQAVMHGYSEHLPGGLFPAAFLFITVDPQLVDFNVHPAKREVRFRNLSLIHQTVVSLIRGQLGGYAIRSGLSNKLMQTQLVAETPTPGSQAFAKPFSTDSSRRHGSSSFDRYDLQATRRELKGDEKAPESSQQSSNLRYHGQIFGLFLLVEYGERLYIIDQHAAHERIIYDKLRTREPVIQTLLVPTHFNLESDDEDRLEKDMGLYRKLGIMLEKTEPGSWLLTACPASCLDMKDDLLELMQGTKGDSTSLEQELYSTIACRSAVMDGEILDDLSAVELAAEALGLENARCPHGRPIWIEMAREKLFELVGRTI